MVANLIHPHVVTIFEMGEQPDFLYFVMQLVEGISLSASGSSRRRSIPLPRKRVPAWTS